MRSSFNIICIQIVYYYAGIVLRSIIPQGVKEGLCHLFVLCQNRINLIDLDWNEYSCLFKGNHSERILIKNHICSICVKQGRLMFQKKKNTTQAKSVNEKPKLDRLLLSLLKNKSQTSWIPHGRVSGGAVTSTTGSQLEPVQGGIPSNVQCSFLYISPGSAETKIL